MSATSAPEATTPKQTVKVIVRIRISPVVRSLILPRPFTGLLLHDGVVLPEDGVGLGVAHRLAVVGAGQLGTHLGLLVLDGVLDLTSVGADLDRRPLALRDAVVTHQPVAESGHG